MEDPTSKLMVCHQCPSLGRFVNRGLDDLLNVGFIYCGIGISVQRLKAKSAIGLWAWPLEQGWNLAAPFSGKATVQLDALHMFLT